MQAVALPRRIQKWSQESRPIL